MKSLLSFMDLNQKQVNELLDLATEIKKNSEQYSSALQGKTLLMIFEKLSYRTRISFEVAMQKMGGHAVVVDSQNSTLGKKETIEDAARVASRYVDCVTARLFEHSDVIKLKNNSTIPVINALTNDFHPCQVLADLLTIKEKKGNFQGLKLAYFGDAHNNVTHDLIIASAMMGMEIFIACPKEASPKEEVLIYANKLLESNKNGKIVIIQDPILAAKNADIIVTDTWMSYHISKDEEQKRKNLLKNYQVNDSLVSHAKKDFIFMHCLPATRENEMTTSIIDGEHSVVFDEAENRLHVQKAVLLKLMGKN